MDLIEGSCCVVTVSQTAAEQRAFSCSGVILDYRTGIIICNGFPFSRFMNHKLPVAPHSRFLLPDTFTADLDIHVHLPARRKVKSNVIPQTDSPSPRKAKVLMLLNCLEFNAAFHALFLKSDNWKFHNDDGMEELIKESRFLSWFAVLQTDFDDSRRSSTNIPWAKSSTLRKGSAVIACGSPFGSLCPDLFSNSLSTGIVSNTSGEDNALILTDARCLPGTEGGGLFVTESDRHAHLVGVIVASLCWKGVEWIGLTLVCSVQVILRNISDITDQMNESPLKELNCLHGFAPEGLHLMNTASSSSSSSKLREYPTVCLIDSGQFWGSGVMVGPRLALTCRHVLNGKKTVTLKFHHKGRFHVVPGDVLFSTKPPSSYDFAVVQLRDSAPDVVVPVVAQSFQPGEEVVVVGYGALGKSCAPSFTGGVLSKVVSWDRRPVLLQTTCAVQAGASGGAVVRKHSGELLGIVSSNTRDCAANVTYPHLNFSIPGTVFQLPLERFSQSGDTEAFRDLDTTDAGVQRAWRLQNLPSKL